MSLTAELARVELDAEHHVLAGFVPEELVLDDARFEELWSLHPPEPPVIHLHGRKVAIPRFQLAFGRDYRFSGATSHAAPLPPLLEPLLAWTRLHLDARINGVLANWYDAALGHDIGAHRDHVSGLVPGVPIAGVSFGATRVMRFRPYRGRGFLDVPVTHGSVVVIPFATNARWTHEVPLRKSESGRRISLTLRAFR